MSEICSLIYCLCSAFSKVVSWRINIYLVIVGMIMHLIMQSMCQKAEG